MRSLLVLGALSLAACSRSGLDGPGGVLVVDPSPIELGPLPSGAVVTQQLALRNVGDAPLELLGGAIGGATPHAFRLGALVRHFEPGEEQLVTLRFTAGEVGEVTAALHLTTDAELDAEQVVPITATVLP